MELWLGNHPALSDGIKITAIDGLWAEFQACIKLGIDPDVMFAKDRFSRMLITGGAVADSMINSMRSYDTAKMREAKRGKK